MPGRKKCFVATLFNEAPLESGGSKIQQVICKFCSLKLSKNGTRMTEHIAKCMKCGDQIKNKYLNDMPFKQKKVQTELMMEEDIPENLPIQCMEKKEKICFSSAILQIPIESFFRTPSCCGNQSRSTTPKFGECKPNKTNSDKPPLKRLHSSTRVPFTPQKNKIASYIFSDKMTNEQIDESQMDLARAVYGTGCSLRVFENKLWIDSFAKLRPAFKLPNRDMLSNSLLERVYNETSTTVKELVGTALSVASLCDGWNNIRNDGIINFVVTVPQPIFWTSIEIGAESHTGEYMANIVKKIICDVGPMKVLGVCTDNAANMKKAWQLIVTEFPHIYPYGCLAHTLNLIFTDASNLKSIADSQRNCTMVVKGIKNSQILSALLKQHQQKSGQIIQQSLKLPVTTRWASIIHCMESLHNNRLALRGLAIDDEAKSLAKPIQNLLLSEVFWDKVDGFIKLLKPIAIAIAAVEGDKLSLSIVAKTFSDLEKSFQDNILCSPILKSEENAMMEIIAKRRKFHIRNIHLAANLVDPRYKGCHISGDEMIDAIETLHKLGKMDSSIKECDDKILGEIADYRSNEGLFAKPFIWASVKHSSPVSWWKGICCSCAPILSNIASKILLLPPTSAAVERSFSRQSWIHNQKRNRLTNDRASKLVFISHNLQLKNLKCNAESSTSQSQEFFLDNGTSQSLESEVSSDSEEYGFDFTIEDLNEQESQNTESFVN